MRKLCDVNALNPGEGLEFDFDGQPAALFRTESGFSAYLNLCPHQGRTMAFAPNRFLFTAAGLLVCPHHGATFQPSSGECTDGPCRGAQLKAIPVELRDDAVWIGDPAGSA